MAWICSHARCSCTYPKSPVPVTRLRGNSCPYDESKTTENTNIGQNIEITIKAKSAGLHSDMWVCLCLCERLANLSFSRTTKCSFTVHVSLFCPWLILSTCSSTHFLKTAPCFKSTVAFVLLFASMKKHSGNMLVTMWDPEGTQGPAAHAVAFLSYLEP